MSFGLKIVVLGRHKFAGLTQAGSWVPRLLVALIWNFGWAAFAE